jgi:molecular chaperone DnaK
VDQWMLAAMKTDEGLTDEDVKEVGTPLVRAIEEAKIALSGGRTEIDVTQLNDITGALLSHTFSTGELHGILERHDFMKLIARTVDRALDAANTKYGTRKRDIHRVFMVGGTSLLLGVREQLGTLFPDTPVQCHHPFGSVAAGACRYAGQDIDPTLVHDYEIESWNPKRMEFDYVPIIPKGTQYPSDGAIKGKYITAACDNARELNLIVYEHSEQVRPAVSFVQGADGRMQAVRVGEGTVERRRPLNPDARDFLRPDPPCDRDEKKRFMVGFGVDENKCLTISVKDTRPGNKSMARTSDGRLVPLPIRDFPLIRL